MSEKSIATLFLIFFVFIVMLSMIDNLRDIEFAKAGLQQCKEGIATIWKKNCDK